MQKSHRFILNGKQCLIGKYDPSNLSRDITDLPFDKLGTEIVAQVEKSGAFTKEEVNHLKTCSPFGILLCIAPIDDKNVTD